MSEKSYYLFYEMKNHVRATGHQAYAVEISEVDRNGVTRPDTAKFTCLNCVVADPDKFVELRREENQQGKQKDALGNEYVLKTFDDEPQTVRTVEIREVSLDSEPSIFPVDPPRVVRDENGG